MIDVDRTWYRETRKNLSRQIIVIRGVGPKSTKVSSCGQAKDLLADSADAADARKTKQVAA